jgi:heat shock protein HtpX
MFAGMAGIMAFIGYTIAGLTGVLIAFLASGIGFFVTSNFSIAHFLRKKKVQYIDPYAGSALYEMVSKLASRAKIEKSPVLFFDNSPEINAYTLEDKEEAAVVLSKGLINNLTKQEIYGVLAHEIAHLKNNDIRIMLFSEQLRKLTGYMALFGQILFVMSLPFLLINQIIVPWFTILLLIFAPTISLLFQVAVSRNREFRADMDAVVLADDTRGLTRALSKINMQASSWKRFYAPYLRDVPEILRTHPNTNARIARLKELEATKGSELGWSL